MSARATKQRELDRAAEVAAQAAISGIDSDALLAHSSVRPIRQQRPVPSRRSLGGPRLVAGQNRRATDRGLAYVAVGPAYDPYSARRRRTPEWLVNYTASLVVGDAAVAGLVLLGMASVGDRQWLSTASGVLVATAWVAALALAGAYGERRLGTGASEYHRVLLGGMAGTAALGMLLAANPDVSLGDLVLVAMPAVTVLSILGRNLQRRRLHRARRQGHMAKRVVVVGREVALVDLVTRLRRDAAAGWQVIGACVPDPASAGGLGREGVHVLGGLDHVETVLGNVRADAVIVASTSETAAAYLRELAWKLEGTNIDLLVVPGLIEVAPDRLHVRPTVSVPLIQIDEPDFWGMRRVVKSAIDRTVALLVLMLLAPLLVVIAVAVKVDSRGPVFYRQRRVGKRGREFGLLKFRSMVVGADAVLTALEQADDGNGVLFKMRVDPRVTGVGRVLRRFSLDELPQLLNVLRGEMSLVGPRPALATEVAQYGDDMQRRLLVKPGVTGLWQVSGRSDLSWDESVELDVRYVENWSLGRDFSILWRTARAVMHGSGAY
ncbi:sugar transferase [Klenkia sp. PcliD-1-E]|uniref:sugar transferase n=1 Tax=Klenkia sp. PcliD-1-E TaxID=2954492 RepID=UPI00209704C7|nr:sugar transferase [Klenkia sp. PcliD-1-E]MCO7222245.1 sugar transferase [Klenkia sp. PcliD-1-E]